MADAKKTIIEVRHIVTGEIAHTIDVTGKSDHLVEKCLFGVLRNMSDDYCATVAEVEHA